MTSVPILAILNLACVPPTARVRLLLVLLVLVLDGLELAFESLIFSLKLAQEAHIIVLLDLVFRPRRRLDSKMVLPHPSRK